MFYRELTGEEEYAAENSLYDGDNEASMYDKLAQFGRTLVGVTAVPKQQFGEIRELVDGEVGGQRGLLAFLAYNSDTWVTSQPQPTSAL